MNRWTPKKIERLRELAAAGMIAVEIGDALGHTQASIITFCSRQNIDVVRYSPEQQAIYDRRAVDREEKRQERKRAANHQKKVAERAAAMSRGDFTPLAVATAHSKTSVAYRRALTPIGEMSKTQLRAMLTEAVRNTAEASV